MIDRKNHYARYCELIWPPAPPPLASGTADTWPPSISFPPTKRCVTSPGAKFAPTVFLSVARRAELSDSQFTAIRSAHNPIQWRLQFLCYPPMILPSAII